MVNAVCVTVDGIHIGICGSLNRVQWFKMNWGKGLPGILGLAARINILVRRSARTCSVLHASRLFSSVCSKKFQCFSYVFVVHHKLQHSFKELSRVELYSVSLIAVQRCNTNVGFIDVFTFYI